MGREDVKESFYMVDIEPGDYVVPTAWCTVLRHIEQGVDISATRRRGNIYGRRRGNMSARFVNLKISRSSEQVSKLQSSRSECPVA